MKLNPAMLEPAAGSKEYTAGKELEEIGAVRLRENDIRYVKYQVYDGQAFQVTINQKNEAFCDCMLFRKGHICRHIVAAFFTAEKEGIPERMLKLQAPEMADQLSGLIYHSMEGEKDIRLEITLVIPPLQDQMLRIGLRIGQKKLYVVKDIFQFLKDIRKGISFQPGKEFTWESEWMTFGKQEEELLNILEKWMIVSGGNTGAAQGRLLPLPQPVAAELLEKLESIPFRVMNPEGKIIQIHEIAQTEIPLHFEISLRPRGLSVTGRMAADMLPVTDDFSYALSKNRIIRVPSFQRKLVLMMWKNQYDGKVCIDYPLWETDRVIGEILPYLKLRGAVEMNSDLKDRLFSYPLRTEIYLDREGEDIIANIHFRYGEKDLNPFGAVKESIALEKGDKLLLRDAEGEQAVLSVLENAGFRVSRNHIRLSGDEALFRFISEDIRKLRQTAEVYLSREFRKISPRRPSLSRGLRMTGNRLELKLEADGEPVEEVLRLIEALSRKRNYYRLKDGSFLDLQDLKGWQEPVKSIYEAAQRDNSELNRDRIVLRSYRTSYLISMLEQNQLAFTADESVRQVTDSLQGKQTQNAPETGIPLRNYQKRGYEWLYMLDRLHMGGILADDMGLGKTVQVIALLTAAREKGRSSLIVAPTSLTYNWLSEVNRFAPDLSTTVISGTISQRTNLLRHISEHGDVDVIITSYPLIRRDISLLKDIKFRFVILDEAQNIKNAGSVAAITVKQLEADTRIALTGTPMENGVGELWSIFDFVLPGYLPGYNAFLRKYQEGENSEDLRRRISPFVTRRLKQDVLEELPDKSETTLRAAMTKEQEQVYRAAMERLRPKVSDLMEKKGRGRAEVLSAMTELRQICCHPALVMEDYRGESGKEELLMTILPGLIRDGRRVLLFSQFTSMLKILRKRLEEENYSIKYLDGDTPADERLTLVRDFNEGETQVFLISLRAGGSGLNLTGADAVIHYDPWWNPAAEEQATDRAHRIGQTKKVDVINLVTGDSIEEQVVELGNRKKALFDRLITPGESQLEMLTEQDIRKLFDL